MSGYLSQKQVDALLQPINPNRVSTKQNMAHLQAYDVRRRLITDFGFARWSGDVLDVTKLYEDITGEGGARRISVGYRTTLRLTVCAPDGTTLATYTECATGDATNFPISKWADAHDFAIKTAESQALKRCAINLGDAYGLGLYNGGKTDPIVHYVLGPDPARLNDDGTIYRPEATRRAEAPKDDHITTQLAPEDSPPGQQEPDTPPPVAPAREENTGGPSVVADIREKALEGQKKAELARLLMRAQKEGVADQHTTDEDGRGLTLEALINARIKAVA